MLSFNILILVDDSQTATKRKDIYTYQAPWTTYAMAWCVLLFIVLIILIRFQQSGVEEKIQKVALKSL
jgi:hypothetical protein